MPIVVVLRQPVAVIAALFGKLSKIERVREGFSGRGALWDRRQIQHRKRNGFVSITAHFVDGQSLLPH